MKINDNVCDVTVTTVLSPVDRIEIEREREREGGREGERERKRR